MKTFLEYEVIEEENKFNIQMSKLNKKVYIFSYYLFFLTVIFFICFAFYFLTKFINSYEIFAFLCLVFLFTFIIYILVIYDIVPYNIIIEPERIILYYDRFFLGKKEEIIYKYKIKMLSSRKIVVKGQTRLEIYFKTTENKKIKILRFNYNMKKREFIQDLYLQIAEKLGVVYDALTT